MGRTSAKPDRILDESALNLCVQRWHALIVKGDLATDKDVEDDAETPYVDLGTGVNFGVQ